jgi:hypothetical protein
VKYNRATDTHTSKHNFVKSLGTFFISSLLTLLVTSGLIAAPDGTDDADQASQKNEARVGTITLLDGDDGGPSLTIGGALRYNVILTDYEDEEINMMDGQFTWDTWRINVNAEAKGLKLNFEYRFYPTFNTHFVKQGWIGYDFNKSTNMQVGVTQVPFGNLTYTSHSWWFQAPYYTGMEDDHDMGIKLSWKKNDWSVMAGYFFQPEPAGPAYGSASFGVGGSGRYSYDIIPITGNKPWDYVLGNNEAPQSNHERNQFNLRVTRNFTFENGNVELGASGQIGQIYNSALDESGSHNAFAIHADANLGRWNLKTEYLTYSHDAKNDAGNDVDYVYMAAYGDPYPVATDASMYVAGISYGLPVEWGPISKLTFYNDYTYIQKSKDSYYDSQQNIIGFMISAGNIYTYVDIARGKNHPWLTQNFGTGLARGVKDARWNTRFNINIGYYF